MKKIKPFIKPIVLLTLGIVLIILFRDKYIEFFSPKKEKKAFTIEVTRDYQYQDGDLLYNIDESIDSYIVIKNNKILKNFKVISDEINVVLLDEVDISSTISLMINHNNYDSIITFNIDDKSYLVTSKKDGNDIKISVEEKQE